MGVKTEKKDQATLIAELISRVTSLEDTMEFVLEHLTTRQTEKCDDCIMEGGDNMRNDRTYIAEPYMSKSPKGQIGE